MKSFIPEIERNGVTTTKKDVAISKNGKEFRV
jgi:hypothetical protein